MKRYTSFLASAAVAAVFLVPAFAFAADPNWTLNAPSNIDFSCGGTYSHTLGTVFQDINGNLTGTGYYNTDPSYTWNLTGVISGNTINFTILYTSAAAGSTYNSVGTINPDGSITGTTDGNCSAFSMAAGSASPVSMVSCPVGTVQTLLETIPVNSASIGGANSVASLAAGQSYIFSASDTWNNRSGETVDAKYVTMDNWVTPTDAPSGGYPADLLELQANSSIVNWGAYSPAHIYSTLFTGAGETVNFRVYDGTGNNQEPSWFGDNVGSLSVNVYSCVPDVVTPPTPVVPTTKGQCKNNGWKTLKDAEVDGDGFKNQGDCVSFVATKGKNKGAGN